jgi:hypothetical protein
MKAKAAATPARPRPAWRLEAAPVLSGRPDLVADAAPVPLGRRELGTDMDLVGRTMVELPAGAPVLMTAAEVLVMTVVALAELGRGLGSETG